MWIFAVSVAGACDLQVVEGQIAFAVEDVTFAHREAVPLDPASTALTGVACLLAQDPALTVQVEVHTDSMGAASYNQRLSQQRADGIRGALLALGADSERLTAAGYGETVPLASNQTAEGRGSNRRIEFHTVPPSERPPVPPAPPAPPPEVAPEPIPVDLCLQTRLLRPDRVPNWPGAQCEGTPWSCTVQEPFSQVSAALTGCFAGVLQDGDQVFLQMHGATLVFAPANEGTSIRVQ